MKDRLTVATILKPQGIRGEVKIKVFCDGVEDLFGVKTVYIDGSEYSVSGIRGGGEFAYMMFNGVFDRNAAELLRGKDIEVLRSELPELPEGRYYIADLTGCEVVTSQGEVIGQVISVTPARTDIYTLKTTGGEVSFAAADGVIETVDTEEKKITVNKKRFKEVSV